jgi:hypothetical protein
MEVDQETVSSPNRHEHSKRIFLYMSCGGKMMHKIFPEILVRKLIIHLQEENVTASSTSRDRPSPYASQHSRMEVKHSQQKKNSGVSVCFHCEIKNGARCISVGSVTLVCVANCFAKQHMRLNVIHKAQSVALSL